MSGLLWDVLSVTVHALLHTYIGPVNAWPAVAVLCAVCALDRDLDIHELVSAVYMLRYSCSTTSVSGPTAYVVCVLVTAGSAAAHMKAYMTLPHTFRRPCLFALVLASVMLRYPWNVDPMVSVLHLVLYTVVTRHRVSSLRQDSWDAAVQSIWILAAPIYACAILIIPLSKFMWDVVYSQRLIGRTAGWSAVAEQDTLV